MTLPPHVADATRADGAAAAPAGLPDGLIEVRWSALRPVAAEARTDPRAPFTARSAFVLIIRPVDENHALLETWTETPAGLRSGLVRKPAGCSVARDGELLHVDLVRNGRRIVALTLAKGAEGRPRYAATSLLADAGFTAGSYDPPTARLEAVERDMVSA